MDAATARNRLLGLRRQLATAARTRAEDLDPQDRDAAATTLDEEVEAALSASLDGERHEVERALDRLDHGTYGRCEVCGTPIPDERLWTVPWTRCCVEHERAAEAPRSLLSGAATALTARFGPSGTSDGLTAPPGLDLPVDDDDALGPVVDDGSDDSSAEAAALHVVGAAPEADEDRIGDALATD
jgi:RNA polymerase-binding transcription factor DksA